jgi:hypothetical protein
MASIDSLRRELRLLREKIAKPSDPKHWLFTICGQSQIPEVVLRQMSPHDTRYVRRIVSEEFDLQPASCTVIMANKQAHVVDLATGEWSPVKRSI